MRNNIKLVYIVALVIAYGMTYPMSDDANTPLLSINTAYDRKEAVDNKAPEIISIDIKEESPEEEIVALLPDHAAIEVATPEPDSTPGACTTPLRYLDGTGLNTDVQKIIAGYLSADWICISTFRINEQLSDALIMPNGLQFITSGDTVKLWDIETNKPTIAYGLNGVIQSDSLNGTYIKIDRLAVSPNGQYLATVANPNSAQKDSIYLYTVNNNALNTYACIKRNCPPSAVTFSPDNHALAAVYAKATIAPATIEGETLSLSGMRLMHADDQITSLAFHPDNAHIAFTSYKKVRILPFDHNKKIAECRLPNNPHNQLNLFNHPFVSCAFRPDGKMLVAGSFDILLIWNLENKTFKIYQNRAPSSAGENKWIGSLICTKDRIIYAIDTQIHILENCFSAPKKMHETMLQHDQQILRLSRSNNNILVSSSRNGTIKLWQSKADLLDKRVSEIDDLSYAKQVEQVGQLSCCDKITQCKLAYQKPLKYLRRFLYAGVLAGMIVWFIIAAKTKK